MSQKQLKELRSELKKLERELAEYQHQNLLGRALQILPKVQDLRGKVAQLSTKHNHEHSTD
jgi:ribosomal protein L29